MNWKNFFDFWETYCKKVVRERGKATEKDKGWHWGHSGFYEPYFGEPDDCSAVCIFYGRELTISYLNWILKTYSSYKENVQYDCYWLPENKKDDHNLLNSRRI